MKKIYFIIVTLFFVILILEHDNIGVAYNPLFHIEGGDSDNAISMPCGLGGSHNHKHEKCHLTCRLIF